MSPSELSLYLRNGSDGELVRRRGIAWLAIASCCAMATSTLYQLGIVHHIPDPPLPRFHADRVSASAEAYALFQTPDGALGLLSYAMTLVLTAMGGPERARKQPLLSLLLAGKIGFDAVQAARYSMRQVTRQHALCGHCLLASGATLAMIPLILPEALWATRVLRRSSAWAVARGWLAR